MTKTISTEKLRHLRKSSEGFLLIDVLPKESFDKDHIPGARNVPLDTADFSAAVAHTASGSKARKIVLYCSGPECDASTEAAKLLMAGGFTNIVEYEGGMSEWNLRKQQKAKVQQD
ncbi:MAG: rhodanese-like domain-containing protein [Planctomycetota bacterium]